MIKKLAIAIPVVIVGILSISLVFLSKDSRALAQQEYNVYIPAFLEGQKEVTFSSFGPDGGTIVSIEIDPANPNVIYVGFAKLDKNSISPH